MDCHCHGLVAQWLKPTIEHMTQVQASVVANYLSLTTLFSKNWTTFPHLLYAYLVLTMKQA